MEINMATDIHHLSTHIRGKGAATIFGEPSLHYRDSLSFLMLIKTSSGLLTPGADSGFCARGVQNFVR